MTIISAKPLKLLFISTSVGPLGSGLGGGVELSLRNIAQAVLQRGHIVRTVSALGSKDESLPDIVQISGDWQITAQSQERNVPIIMSYDSLLANMWDYSRQVQTNYDLIVNFAYDWLPFYLTPFFQVPIAHIVSMSSLSDAMDRIISQVATQFPSTVGFYSHSQAATFPFMRDKTGITPYYLKSGLDLSLYQFNPRPQSCLAWLGRISPEKGLEDAVAAAQITNIPLKIMGKMQDYNYWQQICREYPNAPIEYLGFLSTDQLQQAVGQCRALLMTPTWEEAFGNVVIEAFACGVPVIAYRRGGPAELIEDGKTGFLVEPDSVTGLVQAIANVDKIDRATCRKHAETEYSLKVVGDSFEKWFYSVVQGTLNREKSKI